MNHVLKERLLFFRKMEKLLREMNREGVVDCSEATLRCIKHILKELKNLVYRIEVVRIEQLKAKGKITPKEAVHRKSLLKKRYF